jgi:large subunit ribosomal protein L22
MLKSEQTRILIMQVRSTYKYARISASKAREVARILQGLPVSAALDIVAFSPKKAAGLFQKTLKSAIANAENNNDLRVDSLVVKEATVGEGPTLKRFQPKARGSAGPIRKRTSHLNIILTDEIPIVTRESRRAKKPKSVAKGNASSKAKKLSNQKKAVSEVEELSVSSESGTTGAVDTGAEDTK